jgi:hypothetical protein
MIIIQILLIIFAWRNGWKWISLLPTIICFFIGFLIGIGISGGEVNSDVMGFSVIFDILAIIALILMIANEPKNYESKEIKK